MSDDFEACSEGFNPPASLLTAMLCIESLALRVQKWLSQRQDTFIADGNKPCNCRHHFQWWNRGISHCFASARGLPRLVHSDVAKH